MKKFAFLLLISSLLVGLGRPAVAAARPAYFALRVYHFKSPRQEAVLDSFLQRQYLPVLHAAGVSLIGVFKPLANDTAADKRVYVLTPFASLRQWEKLEKETAPKLLAASGSYESAPYDNPAYTRFETSLLQAFADMPGLAAPRLDAPRSERVYELRSYEGASEKLFRTKVQMFNAGGEIKLFDRLSFNAVFYGAVVAGPRMPNLMYMTTFANMAAREAHWQSFGADPEWKQLASRPEYQHNVSHIDITFLRPTAYSDL